jgi:hypothetical protein
MAFWGKAAHLIPEFRQSRDETFLEKFHHDFA